jgi:dihydroorotate dehydrogenase
MPDWTYQTILGPAVRAVPAPRRWLLRFLDAWGRSPLAGPVVGFVGHMRAGPEAQVRVAGRDLPSAIGLSCGIPGDGDLLALTSRFGVGFAEVGPVSDLAGDTADGRVVQSAADIAQRLDRPRSHACPIIVRLAPRAGRSASESVGDLGRAASTLSRHATVVTLEARPDWSASDLRAAVERVAQGGMPILLLAATHTDVERARDAGADGVWLQAPGPGMDPASVRQLWPQAVVVAAHELVEPVDAVTALRSGANLVALDKGLLESGPGLPKRIHEALRHAHPQPEPSQSWGLHSLREPWAGMAILALVILGSGVSAWLVGTTRVLLTYDEEFLGMDRAALTALNPRLLDFLEHDRISFAATTVSVAIQYLALAVVAARRHEHWARVALVASSCVGLVSFFLFLGFSYFDPLHLVVWIGVAASLLWGLRGPADRLPRVPVPDLRNDAAWKRGQWGQLLYVGLGAGLVLAGVTVSVIACTQVFIATDLDFLHAQRSMLEAANPKLLPLVSHDRAGFGGALAADGVAVLLTALWGFRRGARWVWWTLLASGLVGFAGVVWIHASIGYLHPWHMAPAYLALAVFAVASALTCSWLTAQPPEENVQAARPSPAHGLGSEPLPGMPEGMA